jgi:hypothetical protein
MSLTGSEEQFVNDRHLSDTEKEAKAADYYSKLGCILRLRLSSLLPAHLKWKISVDVNEAECAYARVKFSYMSP